jgi:hypothetical protein
MWPLYFLFLGALVLVVESRAVGRALDWGRELIDWVVVLFNADAALKGPLIAFCSALLVFWLTHLVRLAVHRREYRRKLLNTGRAILLEISRDVHYAKISDDQAHWDRIIDNLNRKKGNTPFFVAENSFTSFFDKLANEILLLPQPVFEKVFDYYKVSSFADDVLVELGSARFAALENDRKIGVVRYFRGLLKDAFAAGEKAIRELDEYLFWRRLWPL